MVKSCGLILVRILLVVNFEEQNGSGENVSIQMPISHRMDKLWYISPNKMLYSNENVQAIITCNDVDKTHLMWSERHTQGYTLCESTYLWYKNKQTKTMLLKIRILVTLGGGRDVTGNTVLKPPTLARHHSNNLHELFYNRRS